MRRTNLLMAVLCMLIIIVGLLTACGSNPESNNQKTQNSTASTSTPATSDANVLYFVGEADYSPISFEQNGEAAGICPDIIREVFKRMDKKVKVEVKPWKRAVEMAKTGEADGFFSPYRLPEREQVSLFPSEPLIIEKNILMVRKDAKIEFDGDIAKLKQYSIGTLEGYATLDKYVSEGKITKAHCKMKLS